MNTENQAKIFTAVDLEFSRMLGREILVTELYGYKHDDSVDLYLTTPAKVRIVETSQSDLHRTLWPWVDPYWNLELVEPHKELEGVTSLWMFGTSYHLETLEADYARIA